ncbi:hypothetical protein [Desulfuromonas sp.]|uniref:hypothetical protein n=1 Tax=Desulfuromonas sp. TaxID=892 RepID=UPI0025BD25B5|nr:hypothetical protein [Desulfuromonas sp.]
MEYLILWVVFGFAAASLAKGKNRNHVLWFFIGLLLGPFAVLAVALMKPAPGANQGYE